MIKTDEFLSDEVTNHLFQVNPSISYSGNEQVVFFKLFIDVSKSAFLQEQSVGVLCLPSRKPAIVEPHMGLYLGPASKPSQHLLD